MTSSGDHFPSTGCSTRALPDDDDDSARRRSRRSRSRRSAFWKTPALGGRALTDSMRLSTTRTEVGVVGAAARRGDGEGAGAGAGTSSPSKLGSEACMKGSSGPELPAPGVSMWWGKSSMGVPTCGTDSLRRIIFSAWRVGGRTGGRSTRPSVCMVFVGGVSGKWRSVEVVGDSGKDCQTSSAPSFETAYTPVLLT